jgi:hypothetical protein
MLLNRRAFAKKGKVPVDVASSGACLPHFLRLAAVAISMVTCSAQIATQATCNAELENVLRIFQAQGGLCDATSVQSCDSTGTASVGPCSSESVCTSEEASKPSNCPPSQNCCFSMMTGTCLPDPSTFVRRRLSDFTGGSTQYCDMKPICAPQCLAGVLRSKLVNLPDM